MASQTTKKGPRLSFEVFDAILIDWIFFWHLMTRFDDNQGVTMSPLDTALAAPQN